MECHRPTTQFGQNNCNDIAQYGRMWSIVFATRNLDQWPIQVYRIDATSQKSQNKNMWWMRVSRFHRFYSIQFHCIRFYFSVDGDIKGEIKSIRKFICEHFPGALLKYDTFMHILALIKNSIHQRNVRRIVHVLCAIERGLFNVVTNVWCAGDGQRYFPNWKLFDSANIAGSSIRLIFQIPEIPIWRWSMKFRI